MAKICRVNNCNYPVFSHDLCRLHQWMRTDEKYLAYKNRKRQGRIPAKSKKRKVEEKYYAENCKDLTREIRERNNGKIHCFFSGKEIGTEVHYHHLKSRVGKFYIDKEWLVPAIDEYHLDYHGKSIDWLLRQDWYTGIFLPNLRKKSVELYQKELRKKDKAKQLKLDEYFD